MRSINNNKSKGKLLTLFSAALLAVFANSGQAATPDITNPQVVEAFVDGVVKPTMAKAHSPSGVVLVMKGDDVILAKGYGYRDLEKRIPVDPETTLFRPGSISKLFTWVSVMQLVEQGKLDLDADANRYLKTFQIEDTWPGQPVTLRHIMTHTAGFEDGGYGYLIADDPERVVPLAESLARYQPQRVNPPGRHTAYSNWATALAGLVVANVSGTDFNTYVQQNIFDVLGMAHSTFAEPLPPALEANMAVGYHYAPDRYEAMGYEYISNFGPAGALASTAHDMARFGRALLNGGSYRDRSILKAETLQQMLDDGFTHDERVRAVGLGLLKRRFGPDGFDNFGHDGATTLFLSHLGLSKAQDLVLFSSFSGVNGARRVHDAFVKSFYDEFFPRDLPAVTPPADFSERAQRYAGNYLAWRGNFTKAESLARLLSGTRVQPQPDGTLLVGKKRYVEVGENLFREVNDYGRIAFQENEQGEISGFVIDGMGVNQMYRAPFYESSGFTFTLTGLSLLLFASVFLRLGYQWSAHRALRGIERHAFSASIALATFNFLFVILFTVAIASSTTVLAYELPTLVKISLLFPLLAAAAALYHLYCAVQLWRHKGLSGTWARVRYSLVSLCGLFMLWFYWYWNLLGFQYY